MAHTDFADCDVVFTRPKICQRHAWKPRSSFSITTDATTLVACAEAKADGGSIRVDSRINQGVQSSNAR